MNSRVMRRIVNCYGVLTPLFNGVQKSEGLHGMIGQRPIRSINKALGWPRKSPLPPTVADTPVAAAQGVSIGVVQRPRNKGLGCPGPCFRRNANGNHRAFCETPAGCQRTAPIRCGSSPVTPAKGNHPPPAIVRAPGAVVRAVLPTAGTLPILPKCEI